MSEVSAGAVAARLRWLCRLRTNSKRHCTLYTCDAHNACYSAAAASMQGACISFIARQTYARLAYALNNPASFPQPANKSLTSTVHMILGIPINPSAREDSRPSITDEPQHDAGPHRVRCDIGNPGDGLQNSHQAIDAVVRGDTEQRCSGKAD